MAKAIIAENSGASRAVAATTPTWDHPGTVSGLNPPPARKSEDAIYLRPTSDGPKMVPKATAPVAQYRPNSKAALRSQSRP
eukprot:CAMPEP_0170164868 /NCGR_PEP_ID=MMETSP0033_2-20121228/78321_1 /TAXON_ID=195969 /ORGANISM="Dolichomastix tenuilepis, Strain CCMP3274" /LENGTH=80 /DNA_ID=CAMNT_0010402515 /DNA_START=238 /DNA_END=480 /DNA_ORIENTATION=+